MLLKNQNSMIKLLYTIALLLCAVIVISKIYGRIVEGEFLSPQSQTMFYRSESLSAAIEPDVWPPGYPLLLFAARKLDYPLQYVNLALFLLTIALVFVVAKRSFPNISAIWLPLSYAFCAFNYYNLVQLTSEAAVVPLSLLTLLLLADYQRRRTFTAILCLSICCSLLFITRYQTVIWLTPVIIYNLFMLHPLRNASLRHSISFFAIAYLPLAAVMVTNYQQTGHLSGMDRFDWSSRELPGSISYFATSTGLEDNVLLTVKTYWLDFASPLEIAAHDTNQLPHSLSSIEMFGMGLFILVMLVIAYALIRLIRTHESVVDSLNIWQQTSPITLIAAEYLVVYIFVTIILWTIGNNDPLYTRFLYPSYIYFMIGMFSGYSFLRSTSASKISRLPVVMLFLYLNAISLYKLYHFDYWINLWV
jgi:Dolichyl-phosphate-mannose-protein mannosyltransferase